GQGEKEVTLDDNFARGLGFPTVNEFKESLKRQLEMDKDRHNRIDIENQLVDELLKKSKLHTPETLVKRQLERRVHDMHHRLHEQGLPEEEIKKKEESMRKDLEAAVEK